MPQVVGSKLQIATMKRMGREEGCKFVTLALDGRIGATEAFQLSDVCVQMVAENVLSPPISDEAKQSTRFIDLKDPVVISGEEKKDTYRYAMMIKETAVVDGQGRFMIPSRIRETCSLDGVVAVVDMDIYIEVWRKSHMEKKYQDMVRAFKKTNDRLF